MNVTGNSGTHGGRHRPGSIDSGRCATCRQTKYEAELNGRIRRTKRRKKRGTKTIQKAESNTRGKDTEVGRAARRQHRREQSIDAQQFMKLANV